MDSRAYERIGVLSFLSKTEGIGGQIKSEPKDFLVEEITPEGIVLELGKSQEFPNQEGEYTHFTLQKENWDTMRAIKIIANKVGVSHKRFKFAGTKDRRSISTQRVSTWRVPQEKLESVSIKDITFSDFSTNPEPVNLGMLKGNRFTIRIDGVKKGSDKTVQKIVSELDGITPNFFGTQRFGIRLNNHIVGKKILRGEFEEAVMSYLCDVGGEPDEATKAREELRKTKDFKAALQDFPMYLGFEKSVLNHLVVKPTDYIGALRKLPKKLRWMMVHAYQGYIFNLALSARIDEDNVPDELPIVGYNSRPNDTVKKILKDEEIELSEFKVPAMPEMSVQGDVRRCLVPFEDFDIVGFNEKEANIVLRFILPAGAYATVVLREIMK